MFPVVDVFVCREYVAVPVFDQGRDGNAEQFSQFYVELKGDLQSSRRGKYMMEELAECCDKLKMIGTFNENSKI